MSKSFSISLGVHNIHRRAQRVGVILKSLCPIFLTGLENDEQPYISVDNDNSIIFSDFRFNYSKDIDIFGELIIDDFQIDDTGEDNALGYKMAIEGLLKLFNNLYFSLILRKFQNGHISMVCSLHFAEYGSPNRFKFG